MVVGVIKGQQAKQNTVLQLKTNNDPFKCGLHLTLLALGGGVFHVNFVCLLITFLVLVDCHQIW